MRCFLFIYFYSCFNFSFGQSSIIDTSDVVIYTDYSELDKRYDSLSCIYWHISYNSDTVSQFCDCYFSNSKIQFEGKFFKKMGFFTRKEYYPNGQLKSYEHLYYGNQIGVGIYYYENGNLMKEGQYYGSELIVLEKDESSTVEGLAKHGIWNYWSSTGEFIKKEIYKKGELVE